jgi:hypothetical protein
MERHLKIIIMSMFISGCVSVQLSGSKGTPAKNVQFEAPGDPFKSIKAPNSDKTWLSEKTGNTISFLSECGNTSDPGLGQIESESLGVLNNLNIEKAEVTQFNGREARQTVATGEIDGVAVRLALLIFKKNNCNYTISYGGVAKEFTKEERYFNNFTKMFKAP